jgi:hypothetical protein
MSSDLKAFTPLGDTVVLAANTTAPTGIQAPTNNVNDKRSVGAYRVFNSGSETVYISFAPTAAQATTEAVIPTAGNAQAVIPVSAGATEVLRLGDDPFLSGITSTGAATVFVTPGKGI